MCAFDVSIAEREAQVEPYRVLDDDWRELVAGVGDRRHWSSLRGPSRSCPLLVTMLQNRMLPRQRADGELLSHLKGRARPPAAPGEQRRSAARPVRHTEGHHNRQRMQSALGYRTPGQAERAASPNAVHFAGRIAVMKSARVVGCGARGRSG